MYSSTLSLTSALKGVGVWLTSRWDRSVSRNGPVPLYRWLGGTKGRPGQVSHMQGNEGRTRHTTPVPKLVEANQDNHFVESTSANRQNHPQQYTGHHNTW
jgi:hypothetical protein